MSRFLSTLAPIILAATLMAPMAAGQDPLVLSHFRITGYDLQALDLPSSHPDSLVVPVVLDGVPRTLELHASSVRASDFRLLVDDAAPGLHQASPPPPTTYRGALREVPESRVAASLRDGRLEALLVTPEADWMIAPLSEARPGAPAELHVLVRGDEQVGPAGICGVLGLGPGGTSAVAPPPSGQTGTGLQICDIAFDADYEFYQKKGSSIDAAVQDIETILNGVEVIYEQDTSITYEVTTIVVRTAEPDPYSSTSPDTLLRQMRTQWRNNLGAIRRDTAHLMTGKHLDGTVIGIAWLGVICDTGYGYGLSSLATSSYANRVGLMAHEVGHNWNARHCDGDSDCAIMCSGLGGCTGGLDRFGGRAVTAITNFRDSRGCLDPLEDPPSIPFQETFPSTGINPGNWSYVDGAVVNGNALGEPSPPYALELDASGSGDYRDDEVRSNEIPLGTTSLAALSYATEHRGVESGEALLVEFWSEDLRWQEIDRIVSDGHDQSVFESFRHILPLGAYHDRFRVRFRALVNASNDNWYVDDVRLEPASCMIPEIYGQATPGTAGITPLIAWEGLYPYPGGSDYRITATQLYGGQTGFFITGFSRQTVDLGGGCYFNVLPPWFLASFVASGLPLPGYGSTAFDIVVPPDPGLIDLHFMNFVICFDPGGPKGLSGTQGLDSTICGN